LKSSALPEVVGVADDRGPGYLSDRCTSVTGTIVDAYDGGKFVAKAVNNVGDDGFLVVEGNNDNNTGFFHRGLFPLRSHASIVSEIGQEAGKAT
jgi:hypothetical protein